MILTLLQHALQSRRARTPGPHAAPARAHTRATCSPGTRARAGATHNMQQRPCRELPWLLRAALPTPCCNHYPVCQYTASEPHDARRCSPGPPSSEHGSNAMNYTFRCRSHCPRSAPTGARIGPPRHAPSTPNTSETYTTGPRNA